MTATLETLVRRFYHDLWNRFDSTLIPVLLTEDVTLRGALGRHAAGHAAFADYLELVRGAFPDFEQTVEAVEVDAVGGPAFVRLRCRGTHRAPCSVCPRPAGASRSKESPASRPATAIHAFEWLNVRDTDSRTALRQFFQGAFGDPVGVATGEITVEHDSPIHQRFGRLLDDARPLAAEQRFFNWQPAFPLVWSDWDAADLQGGFDAVIGNPPWDRMKFQQVEWFAARRPEIALAQRAADRKRMIRTLQEAGDRLADEVRRTNDRTESAVRVARSGGNYPLLSSGDVNIYSLFVERAMSLNRPDGLVGLITPSGIASDKTAARFFQEIATEGRLRGARPCSHRRPSGSRRLAPLRGRQPEACLAVTPEPPGRLDSFQYRQVQIADLIEQLRGRGPGEGFRQRVPPLPVLV